MKLASIEGSLEPSWKTLGDVSKFFDNFDRGSAYLIHCDLRTMPEKFDGQVGDLACNQL